MRFRSVFTELTYINSSADRSSVTFLSVFAHSLNFQLFLSDVKISTNQVIDRTDTYIDGARLQDLHRCFQRTRKEDFEVSTTEIFIRYPFEYVVASRSSYYDCARWFESFSFSIKSVIEFNIMITLHYSRSYTEMISVLRYISLLNLDYPLSWARSKLKKFQRWKKKILATSLRLLQSPIFEVKFQYLLHRNNYACDYSVGDDQGFNFVSFILLLKSRYPFSLRVEFIVEILILYSYPFLRDS